MSILRISLFGKFEVRCEGRVLTELDLRKVQQLFCYLLLHRDHPHPREALAALLWDDLETDQPNRALRKTLWQLRNALESQNDSLSDQVLLVEPEWVQINPEASLWLDVALFEQAFSRTQGVRGRTLDPQGAQTLQHAVDLYRGGLQASWYQDWYLYERERFKHMYLIMLDKLIGYCEVHGDCEAGLTYGTFILRCEKAHERTHRRLMRLHCLAGDRTAALRQYQRCISALDEELEVKPDQRTVALYHQIRAGQLDDLTPLPVEIYQTQETATSLLPDVLGRLKKLQAVLVDVQRQVRQDIEVVELALNGRR